MNTATQDKATVIAHDLVKSGEWFSNPALAKALQIHPDRTRIALHALERLGHIERTGKTTKRRYRLVIKTTLGRPQKVARLRSAPEPNVEQVLAPLAPVDEFRVDVTTVLREIGEMLVDKNAAYGDSALNPVRVFSRANPAEQLRVRIDDKLSRLSRGETAGEDVERDLLGVPDPAPSRSQAWREVGQPRRLAACANVGARRIGHSLCANPSAKLPTNLLDK